MSGTSPIGGNDAPVARTLELRRGEPAPESSAKLKEIAAGFEALFTGTILSELLKPMEGGGLAGEGPGASVVQGLIESNLSDHLAKSGGFGIGRMVEEQMRPLLAARAVTIDELDALRHTAGNRSKAAAAAESSVVPGSLQEIAR